MNIFKFLELEEGTNTAASAKGRKRLEAWKQLGNHYEYNKTQSKYRKVGRYIETY